MSTRSRKIWDGIGVAFIAVLVAMIVVVLPVWTIATSQSGNKECAAKHGTADVIWSAPDKCYVKQ